MLQGMTVLVVDDDTAILSAAQLLLRHQHASVLTCSDPGEVPEVLNRESIDVVLLDMNFARGATTGEEGLTCAALIARTHPDTPIVLMTAYGGVETAVQALKSGATDFVLKPWHNEKLLATLSAACRLGESREEVSKLKDRQRLLTREEGEGRPRLVAESPAMKAVMAVVNASSPTDANVLILGENGSGKEVIARELHRRSTRADEAFIAVDMGAIPETLFESELFGHRKGAFTDAKEDRIGRLEAASGGTVFLDEIGNLPLYLQAKLLRALEEREVTPLGGSKSTPIDIRLVAATNVPMSQLKSEDRFRQDLLYRINTIEVDLPSLGERKEDIAPLAESFLSEYSRKYDRGRQRLSAPALQALENYGWPGNVRELRHVIERAVIMTNAEAIDVQDLHLRLDGDSKADFAGDAEDLNLDHVEERVIRRALAKNSGNITHAASDLGITRAALYRRLERHGIQ